MCTGCVRYLHLPANGLFGGVGAEGAGLEGKGQMPPRGGMSFTNSGQAVPQTLGDRLADFLAPCVLLAGVASYSIGCREFAGEKVDLLLRLRHPAEIMKALRFGQFLPQLLQPAFVGRPRLGIKAGARVARRGEVHLLGRQRRGRARSGGGVGRCLSFTTREGGQIDNMEVLAGGA